MAPREVLAEAAALYAGLNPTQIDLEPAGGVEVARRVAAGEATDVVVLANNAIDSLVATGRVLSEYRLDLMTSEIAMGVRAGAAHPHPSDAAAVRSLVLNAPSLGYSTGPSGRYLEGLFERWGILDRVRSRIVIPPPGVAVARLIATGDVALGFQQLSELLNVPGVDVLAPLPASIQHRTVFTAGVCTACQAPLEADQFVRFAASRATEAVMRRHGMTPIV
jgi:molybdate transport system substrate-binding protein